MIKINLLKNFNDAGFSSSISTDEDEKKKLILDFSKRAIVLLIGPLGMYAYEMIHLPEIKQKLNEINASIAELRQFNDSKQGLAEEIKKYEEEQNRFNAQTDFINKISKDKENEYKFFKHLKDSISDNVWITKLEFRSNVITIAAETDDTAELNKFTQKLSSVDFLINVVPLNQKTIKDYKETGVAVTTLSIRAQLAESSNSVGGGN